MANEDAHYTTFLRDSACGFCESSRGVQVHHAGPKALGRRNHDWMGVPLCEPCHTSLHSGKGKAGSDETRLRLMRLMSDSLLAYVSRERVGNNQPFWD